MATMLPHMFTQAGWVFAELNPVTGLPNILSRPIQRGDNFWCAALLDNGKIHENWYPRAHVMDAERIETARNVLKYVNAQARYDGCWMVAWFNNFQRFLMVWRDRDGDIQIELPCDEPWARMQQFELMDWEEHCHQSHAKWVDYMKVMEWDHRRELVKAAQGQTHH